MLGPGRNIPLVDRQRISFSARCGLGGSGLCASGLAHTRPNCETGTASRQPLHAHRWRSSSLRLVEKRLAAGSPGNVAQASKARHQTASKGGDRQTPGWSLEIGAAAHSPGRMLSAWACSSPSVDESAAPPFGGQAPSASYQELPVASSTSGQRP